MVLPIPLQHWILWGNPVYPVAHELFGGLLINAWSLERSIMLLDIFSWDGHNIIRQVFSEPLAALGLFGLLSPVIYRHPVHRLAGMIALMYIITVYPALQSYTDQFCDRRPRALSDAGHQTAWVQYPILSASPLI